MVCLVGAFKGKGGAVGQIGAEGLCKGLLGELGGAALIRLASGKKVDGSVLNAQGKAGKLPGLSA